MQGRFEQSLIDAEGAVVEVTSGTLEIERPTKFRWTYTDPYEQWLVADGLNIWSYDVDLAQVTVKPQAEALSNTPALLLGGSSEALEQFSFDGSMEEQGTVWVRMRPVDESSGFNRLELGCTDGQLSRMVFFDNLEQTTLVALYDVVVNEPIDAEQFQFVIPDEADLVGAPVVAAASQPAAVAGLFAACREAVPVGELTCAHQIGREVAGIVSNAERVGVGQGIAGNGVAPADLGRRLTDQARRSVHQPLDEEHGLRLPRAAVGRCRHGAGEHRAHVDGGDGDVVDTG